MLLGEKTLTSLTEHLPDGPELYNPRTNKLYHGACKKIARAIRFQDGMTRFYVPGGLKKVTGAAKTILEFLVGETVVATNFGIILTGVYFYQLLLPTNFLV